MMPLTKTEELFGALLRAALWDAAAEAEAFRGLNVGVWRQVRQLAGRQGVAALVFGAAMQLPEDCRPPREVRLPWGVSTEGVRAYHARQQEVAGHLADFYGGHGIRLMLMKGPGVAACYPEAPLRESGDLDVWLFGEYERGNRLMQERGISVDQHGPKHSAFRFEGVPVENHRSFLNVGTYSVDTRLDAVLRRYTETEAMERLPGTQVLLPPPAFHALFLIRHLLNHFANGGIVVRHLCDWARFLYTHRGRFPAEELTTLLKEAHLFPAAAAVTALTVDRLGLPADCLPFPPERNPEYEQRVMDDILHPRYAVLPEGKGAAAVIAFKVRRLCAERWKYNFVYGRGFGRRVVTSTVSHLMHPSSILRLK